MKLLFLCQLRAHIHTQTHTRTYTRRHTYTHIHTQDTHTGIRSPEETMIEMIYWAVMRFDSHNLTSGRLTWSLRKTDEKVYRCESFLAPSTLTGAPLAFGEGRVHVFRARVICIWITNEFHRIVTMTTNHLISVDYVCVCVFAPCVCDICVCVCVWASCCPLFDLLTHHVLSWKHLKVFTWSQGWACDHIPTWLVLTTSSWNDHHLKSRFVSWRRRINRAG